MRDEDLREEFAAWLRHVREADPPGLPVIKRRLRRRRRRNAIAGTTALAAVAGLAVAIAAALGPPRLPARPGGSTSPLSQPVHGAMPVKTNRARTCTVRRVRRW